MKKISCIITIFIAILLFPQAVKAEDKLYDSYEGDMGIEIKSYTPHWTGEKLEDIYNELFKNTYGEEIEYLSTINLYAGNPSGGQEEGLYHGSYTKNSFLNRTKYKMSKNRYIDLFNMDQKESVEEIAKTLSHEYGHHFTLYYLIKGENKTFDGWRETKYAKIRGLADDNRVKNDYSNGHQWNITEIAAEDYVQIYGSPTAKNPRYFDDIVNRAEKNKLEEILSWDNRIYNLYPQENFNIPLAMDIPILQEYWIHLSGIERKRPNKPPTPSTLALTKVNNLGYNKEQFIIEWTKSKDEDSKDLLYTLIAFDKETQQVIPIKTVQSGEKLIAYIGSVKIKNASNITYYSDTFINQPKHLRVFTMDEYGNIVSSNTLKIDFNKPIVKDNRGEIEATQESPEVIEKNIEEDILNIDKEEEESWIDSLINFLFHFIEKLHFTYKGD